MISHCEYAKGEFTLGLKKIKENFAIASVIELTMHYNENHYSFYNHISFLFLCRSNYL